MDIMPYAIKPNRHLPLTWDIEEISDQDAHDATAVPGPGLLIAQDGRHLERLFWELAGIIKDLPKGS